MSNPSNNLINASDHISIKPDIFYSFFHRFFQKQYVPVFLVILLGILIQLIPVKAGNLHLRFYTESYDGGDCNLYYTTSSSSDYSADKRLVSTMDDAGAIEFLVDGSLSDQLTGLRLDFPEAVQVVGIREIALSSGGVIQKHINPCDFFGEGGMASSNGISELSLIKTQKKAYFVTEAEDPYIVLSAPLVMEINRSFSHFRWTRLGLGFYFVILVFGLCWKKRNSPADNLDKEASNDSLGLLAFALKKNVKSMQNGFGIIVLLGIIYGFLTIKMVLPQLQNNLSDYSGHLYTYLPLFSKETLLEGWATVPYFLWHIFVLVFYKLLNTPLEMAAAYTSAIFALFAYGALVFVLSKFVADQRYAAFYSFCLCLVQGIYFYWLETGDRFGGLFSMNPYHNPTQMCVQGISILCLALIIDIWGSQKDAAYNGIFFQVENGLKKYYIWLSVLLFLSVLAKPTFAEMFIPAVGLIMLITWIQKLCKKENAKEYFQILLKTFCLAIPALFYIFLQFLDYFIFGGSYGDSGSVVITAWMEVWKLFTENTVLSIALGMAFPLYVLLIDSSFFIYNTIGQLGVLSYLIGLLEASLLGESGWKLSHGDFLWPMMSGMLVFWLIAFLRFITLEGQVIIAYGQEYEKNSSEKSSTIQFYHTIKIYIGYGLFFAHVLCGICYIYSLWIG